MELTKEELIAELTRLLPIYTVPNMKTSGIPVQAIAKAMANSIEKKLEASTIPVVDWNILARGIFSIN